MYRYLYASVTELDAFRYPRMKLVSILREATSSKQEPADKSMYRKPCLNYKGVSRIWLNQLKYNHIPENSTSVGDNLSENQKIISGFPNLR